MERCRELDTHVWFRGHADADWLLLPTALRENFLASAEAWATKNQTTVERHTAWRRDEPVSSRLSDRNLVGMVVEGVANNRFRREGSALLTSPEDLRVVYMEARHAGLPSRLMDWTTQVLIALFFASYEQQDCDGVVLVLDPTDYYYYSTFGVPGREDRRTSFVNTPVNDSSVVFSGQLPLLFNSTSEPLSGFEYGPDSMSSEEMEGHNHQFPTTTLMGILPVLPTQPISRMAAQHSCFTFHPPGSGDGGIIPRERLLTAIVVPASEKAATIERLRLLGVDESTVWPSLDSTARAIRRQMGLESSAKAE